MENRKASEIIKNECCGVGLLTIEKEDLVSKVAELENALDEAYDMAQKSTEVNLYNYDNDDVERLNNEMTELYEFLALKVGK